MSTKEIVGFLSILPNSKDEREAVQEEIQGGNLSFREVTRRRTIYFWNNNMAGQEPLIVCVPWKNARLLDDSDPLMGHGVFVGSNYPTDPSGVQVSMNNYDYRKFRNFGTVGTIPSANIPRVIGSIAAYDLMLSSGRTRWPGDNLLSITDIPKHYTQIGVVYLHPTYAGVATVTTSVGLSYIVYGSGNAIFDSTMTRSGVLNLVRIETGADAGFYFIHHNDFTNKRLYLRNLDGTVFSAQASASGIPAQLCPGRRAFFNETSIIPLGVGVVETSGRFSPELRESFCVRVVMDKSGSVATAGAQQGSYYLVVKPWTHGDGIIGGSSPDLGQSLNYALFNGNGDPIVPTNFNFWSGGSVGYAFDPINQRVFFAYTNNSLQSGIGSWRWKTVESFRELSNYLGTPAHGASISPAINLTGPSAVTSVDAGSDYIAYFAINHASGGQGGLAAIKPDLTTFQYTTGNGFPNSQCYAAPVDKSRTRTGTASDVSTNGANQITSGSGSFTAADIGRAIKLTGLGADSGTYKIASIVGGTQVTVTTMAGGGVTFTSQTGGTFQIGDRIYLFFNNGTTGAGKINYMESLSPGNFLTRAVSMTNGATITTHARFGEPMKVSIDQTTGNVYWLSTDTQQQINKYDVTANSHSFRTIADIQSPSGGTGSITNPTAFTAILANPTFDELWVGSNQGHIKIVLSSFTGSGYKRYFGSEQTTYANPAGFLRADGDPTFTLNTRNVSAYWMGPDSKVYASMFSLNSDRVAYSHESDTWSYMESFNSNNGGVTSEHDFIDPFGRSFFVNPGASTSAPRAVIGAYEVQYQWDNANSKWFAKEVAQGALPNSGVSDTISPNCKSKPFHSGFEDLLYGVKIRFTPQGGATPPNNEFLGRAGTTGAARTDGATSTGSATFTGSSFVSGDVGRVLRIHAGSDIGVFKITGFTNSTTISLKTMSGVTFSAAATASSLTYSLWDFGTPGSNAGPEIASFALADGFAKDNTQDISGITYETYQFKTVLHENDEAIKVCVPAAIGPAGSTGMLAYYETFPRATPQYDAALAHHRALPGSPVTAGDTFLDNFVDKVLVGTNGRASMGFADWYGIFADSSVEGCSPIVDLGADADVGFIIIRGQSNSTSQLAFTNPTGNNHGLIADLVNSPNSLGTPVASSSIRTSGSSIFNMVANNSTVSLTTGDFLGSISIGPNSDGVVVAGGNVFSVTIGTFNSAHLGMVLKVTSGTEIGAYRVISVAGDGSSVTIQNLGQTAKQWSASGSAITYEIRNAVRELDMLCSPSLASPTHKLCVERLLTSSTAQVRTPPRSTLSNQNYECVSPSWKPVKRVSYSTEAVPPDVRNNKTWVSWDGREQYNNQDWKIYMDLTDLPSSQRTARYWRMVMTPRFNGNASTGAFNFSTWEFYDTSGNRLGIVRDQMLDEARTNADFLACNVNRVDFIQATDTAVGGSFNGTLSLGGANGDTLTLSGGNKFLGYQVRALVSDGNPISGGNVFNSATAGFTSADIGKFLRVTTGANANSIYRIATRASATQVTLTTPAGNSVTFGSTETSIQFTLHEGFSVGGAYPDYICIGGVSSDKEFSLLTVNDALTQITISEFGQAALSGQTWEIRRRGFDTSSSTTEAGKLARIVRPELTYPVQTGDVAHDSRGALRFFSEDCGASAVRTSGSITGGSGVFTGTLFCQDDVGRYLVITTGVNKGTYRISAFSSSTSITVVNAYTGAAVSFTADAGPVSYKILGERRFRASRFIISLRA